MASGKSLELAKIKPKPAALCICGKAWPDHLRKDGEVMVKYRNEKHRIAEGAFFNRRQRRQAERAMRHD